ncbi:MAG: transporter substrate-binding domain-containing protein, partial [Cellulomonas sp.]|nr:transporter substrate-binding domain-containing protein [Cellulomonas sp.]
MRAAWRPSVRTTPLALVAVAAVTLSLTACGGGSGTPAASSSGSAAGASAAATFDPSSVKKDDTLAALLPDKVKSAGTLTVGADTSYAPAEYIAEDGKTPVGYDVGISSFTINSDREQKANMIAYFQAGEAYAVQKGNPNKVDPTNLCGLTVGIQTGTVEDDEFNAVIAKCKTDGKKAPNPLKYAKQSDVTTALVGGKADVMYADSPIIAYAIAQTNGQLEQLGDVFSSAPQGIVVSKDDT